MRLVKPDKLKLVKKSSLEGWNDILRHLPGAHLLQTQEWSSIKAPLGWSPLAYTWEDEAEGCHAACLILKRKVRILPGLLSVGILYSPRGPVLDWHDQPLVNRVLTDLQLITHKEGSIFIKIDPEIVQASGLPGAEDEKVDPQVSSMVEYFNKTGWQYSAEQVQFRNTITIDLTSPDTVLLERMKQKTRYNIRLAERKGVIIRNGTMDDAPILSKMYMETALRNGFAVREREYYERVWRILYEAGMLTLLIADVDSEPVAGLVLFHFAERAYYFYGMSTEHHRECMPTYLLQWKAIQVSREQGCSVYDLWGAPDDFIDSDNMWGVFRFKEGLGGQVLRTIGAWDYPAQGWLYRIYTGIMPRILSVMRAFGQHRTEQETSA
jgi:peptidoglycan pentaglycine glycine transferase (the first glycine)